MRSKRQMRRIARQIKEDPELQRPARGLEADACSTCGSKTLCGGCARLRLVDRLELEAC